MQFQNTENFTNFCICLYILQRFQKVVGWSHLNLTKDTNIDDLVKDNLLEIDEKYDDQFNMHLALNL